jgi:hypothetical protein
MKLAIFVLSLGCGTALAQTPAPTRTPASDPQLASIRARMADNLRRLPNYTCLMTVERSAMAPPNPEVDFRPGGRPRSLTHQDTIRLEVAEVGGKEFFGWPGTALVDERIQDFVPDGLFANGDFAGVANMVFLTSAPTFRPAGNKKIDGREAVGYSYSVARAASQYSLGRDGQLVTVPYHGAFWADAQSLETLRLELELDGIPDGFAVRTSVTAIEYRRSGIGGADFLLPSRVQRDVYYSRPGGMSENVSTFTNCRQYEAQSALRFEQPTDAAPTAAGPRTSAEIRLPAGLRLPMKVETVTDAKTSAIGDPLLARLTEDVHFGDAVFPAGSEVHGRIRSMHWNVQGPGQLELTFTEIRTPKEIVTFQGVVGSVEKRKGFSSGNMSKTGELQVDPKYFNLAGLVLTYRTMADSK